MQELTQHGSVIERELSPYSLAGFEAGLGNGWSFLTSDQPNCHAVFVNEEKLSLVTYCEGDVITKRSPNEFVFSLEKNDEMWFTANA
ncbi:hypothetical protein [Rheinheimera hassiensis]|uniref:hypothetical protein n=1 Tax=Rheinheimera hassiensis TaxID=1193627 RepID=UPI001F05A006|nr:hypothetical protein [Rheinheimera hassiensis]